VTGSARYLNEADSCGIDGAIEPVTAGYGIRSRRELLASARWRELGSCWLS